MLSTAINYVNLLLFFTLGTCFLAVGVGLVWVDVLYKNVPKLGVTVVLVAGLFLLAAYRALLQVTP